MNDTKSYYLIFLLISCLLPYGCKPETAGTVKFNKDGAGKNVIPTDTKLSARDHAINTAPTWYVYHKSGDVILEIKNVPGYIKDILGFKGKTHPFIDLTLCNGDNGNSNITVYKLLERSHSFDEYVALLKKNGYKVVPTPQYDKNGSVTVSTTNIIISTSVDNNNNK